MMKSSKGKSDYIKGQIRDRLGEKLGKYHHLSLSLLLTQCHLADITGNPKAVMHYVQYHKEIVMRYGVALKGWTHPMFANPSDLSTSLPPLQELLNAINSDQCKFVNLTSEQQKAEDNKYQEKIRKGEITVPVRATRKDKGKKRKVQEAAGDSNDDEDGENGDGNDRQGLRQPAKRRRLAKARKPAPKSMEHVNSDSDN
jgi:hypothetical protein